MAMSDHITRVSKLSGKVVTVDPSNKKIEIVTADGATRQLAIFDVRSNFTWPVEGENWTIVEESGYWKLGEKYLNPDETTEFTDLLPGETYSQISFQAGDLKVTARPEIPRGWLACDGSFVKITDYTTLFTKIGHNYNCPGGVVTDPGDGTFRLPSLASPVASPILVLPKYLIKT